MYIRVRRQAKVVTTPTAMMGTLVRLSTLLMMEENGVPLSRAKDQVIRDAVVVMPMAHAHVRTRTTAPIAVAPAMDWTPSVQAQWSAVAEIKCERV